MQNDLSTNQLRKVAGFWFGTDLRKDGGSLPSSGFVVNDKCSKMLPSGLRALTQQAGETVRRRTGLPEIE